MTAHSSATERSQLVRELRESYLSSDHRFCSHAGLLAKAAAALDVPSETAATENWVNGGKVHHRATPSASTQPLDTIPEYFAKPGVTEGLALAHPTLLVRQMANEILRLRSTPSATAIKGAVEEIAAERRRQVEKEGWSEKHDDEHGPGTLAVAGACYALAAACETTTEHASWIKLYGSAATDLWPWDREWWKPKDARRDLIRAAALLVAEIERIDRSGAMDSKGAGT